jgi:hypothetical protein
LFTSPENFFTCFPQPPFSSINNGNLPAKGGKLAYSSSEHPEVFSFLPLRKSLLSVLRPRNTMGIVLWSKTRVYFFSSPYKKMYWHIIASVAQIAISVDSRI